MADGSGGGIGKAVADSAKDIGADLTVNMVKDIFDTLGSKKPAQAQTQSPQQNTNYTVQKNIRMATISRRIQQMAMQRKIASQQAKQQEQMRQQAMQEEKQVKKMHEQKAEKKNSNWISKLVQRAGKGEMRGQKLTG